ncbi:proline-rich protein 9-like isoform X2 [Hyla sarda]|uniref:proline-rich protein 9-like isoform X2 n=1 Tax=Hyla sarda TaxID=327740 RepID=UPI0024C33414|nr:proline-rich protein 9-like isoform X2 [Hyla sarda]
MISHSNNGDSTLGGCIQHNLIMSGIKGGQCSQKFQCQDPCKNPCKDPCQKIPVCVDPCQDLCKTGLQYHGSHHQHGHHYHHKQDPCNPCCPVPCCPDPCCNK